MKRGTTPTHTFELPDNASEYEDIHITYQQKGVNVLELDKSDLTIEDNVVSHELTQTEANLFDVGQAFVQVRVRTDDDLVMASDIICFNVGAVLCDEELPIEEG